jgi:hypothetical protein
MNALISKTREATTDQLLEMAMLLTDAAAKEGVMARMAVMVALEERMSGEEFVAFCDGLEA